MENDQNDHRIIQIYKDIQAKLEIGNHAHLTLVTKVMMGVFGFVPAFDFYFVGTFREIFPNECYFNNFDKSLEYIREFYKYNHEVINSLSSKIFTINFSDGKPTDICYPKAKIIDMYGFMKGYEKYEQEKKKKLDLTKTAPPGLFQ